MQKCRREILDFRVSLLFSLIISISIFFYAHYRADAIYINYLYSFSVITTILILLAYFFNSVFFSLLLAIAYVIGALLIFTLYKASIFMLLAIPPVMAFLNIFACSHNSIVKIESERKLFGSSIFLELRRYTFSIFFLLISYLLFMGFDIPTKHGGVISHEDYDKYFYLLIAIISWLGIKFSYLFDSPDNKTEEKSELHNSKDSFKLKLIDSSKRSFKLLKEELQSYYKQLGYKEVIDNENSWMIKNSNNSYVYLSQKDKSLELEIYKAQKPNLPYLDKLIKKHIIK